MADYLENNRLIAHYCGFYIMKPLPSYWTYDRFLRQLDNGEPKRIMVAQVRKLYELGVVDASFIGMDSTPVAANTKQNNPKSFVKNKFSKQALRERTEKRATQAKRVRPRMNSQLRTVTLEPFLSGLIR